VLVKGAPRKQIGKMNFISRKVTFPNLFVLMLWFSVVTTANVVMNTITQQWANLEYTNKITGCDAFLVSAPEYRGTKVPRYVQ
jgi:hypothetical protein